MNNAQFGLSAFVFLLVITPFVLHATRANIFLVFAICTVLVNLLAAAIAPLISPIIDFWLFTPPYYFLIMLFALCRGAVFSSVSLEVLHDIYQNGGRVRAGDLYEDVVQIGMNLRIAEHLSRGWVTQTDNRLDLTSRGQRIALAVAKLKALFALPTNGIY
jgi:hypothetical protein